MNSIKKKLGEWLGINPFRWSASVRNIVALADQTAEHNSHHPVEVEQTRTVGIVVNVWLTTLVPWYAVVMGLVLSTRGNKVVYIFDDLPFGNMPAVSAFIRHCLRRVMRHLAARYTVITVSDHLTRNKSHSPEELVHIERLAELNAVHKLRGETQPEGRITYTALVRSQLCSARPAIASIVKKHQFNAIVVPGGVYGTSGLWMAAGKEWGVRVSSFDAGAGIVLLAANGVASQLQDIPAAFAQLKSDAESPRQEALMLELARAEIEKRHSGRSAFNYQQTLESSDSLDKYKDAILIALNSSWDQAALGLHVVFRNSAEWIVESVRWILENTESKVIVRQHPAERFELTRTSDDYESLLRKEFGNHERLFFIAAANPINTYDLLAVVSAVLAYTSTLGVEATALRKPTITASKCYYSSLGFVWSAKSRDTYFEHLSKAVNHQLTVTEDMERDALLCYYTTQVCNWIFTPFNPVGDEFLSQSSLAELKLSPDVDLILKVIETGTPSAIFNHQKNIQKNRHSTELASI
jgi:hypothetical protein